MAYVFSVIWRALSIALNYVPGWMFRWYYTQQRLNSIIRIDVRPRGDQLSFWVDRNPHATLYLQIVNHSPFNLTLEHLKAEVWCDGRLGTMKYTERKAIGRNATAEVFVEDMQGYDFKSAFEHQGRIRQPTLNITAQFRFGTHIHRFLSRASGAGVALQVEQSDRERLEAERQEYSSRIHKSERLGRGAIVCTIRPTIYRNDLINPIKQAQNLVRSKQIRFWGFSFPFNDRNDEVDLQWLKSMTVHKRLNWALQLRALKIVFL